MFFLFIMLVYFFPLSLLYLLEENNFYLPFVVSLRVAKLTKSQSNFKLSKLMIKSKSKSIIQYCCDQRFLPTGYLWCST